MMAASEDHRAFRCNDFGVEAADAPGGERRYKPRVWGDLLGRAEGTMRVSWLHFTHFSQMSFSSWRISSV